MPPKKKRSSGSTQTSRSKRSEENEARDFWIGFGWTVAHAAATAIWDKVSQIRFQIPDSGKNQTKDTESQSDGEVDGSDPTPWWSVLEIKPYSTEEEIRKAYREKMAKTHPDKVAHLSEKLNQAYNEALSSHH